jgi:hypothetical protein
MNKPTKSQLANCVEYFKKELSHLVSTHSDVEVVACQVKSILEGAPSLEPQPKAAVVEETPVVDAEAPADA